MLRVERVLRFARPIRYETVFCRCKDGFQDKCLPVYEIAVDFAEENIRVLDGSLPRVCEAKDKPNEP